MNTKNKVEEESDLLWDTVSPEAVKKGKDRGEKTWVWISHTLISLRDLINKAVSVKVLDTHVDIQWLSAA